MSTLLLSLALVAPSDPASLPLPSPVVAVGVAPDGRAGLGAELELSVLLKLLRTPTDEEEALLAELAQLPAEAQVLAANVEGVYRSRGYYAIVGDRAEPTLADLHAEFRRLSLEADELLFRRDDVAIAYARMHLDTRFRARMALLETRAYESAQVTRGLALLDAAADTYVVLAEDEGRNAMLRVDLAASALRALVLDLAALREAPGWPTDSGPTDDAVAAYLALSAIEDPSARRDAVLAEQAEQARRAARMVDVLASTRLERDADVAALLAWRDGADERARALRADAERVWPDGDGELQTDESLASRTKTDRRREARAKALEALAHDPLDDRAAYVAATTSRLVHGVHEALSHYDRYLSLRGIRYMDDRTYRRRELTWEEGDALLYLQSTWEEPPPVTSPVFGVAPG